MTSDSNPEPNPQAGSLVAVARQTAQRFAQDTAVVSQGKRLSFQELDRLSDNVAAKLAADGVQPGNRVALYCINSEHFVIAYLAIVKAGATVVAINLLLPPSEIEYILQDAGATTVIYHQALSQNVTAVHANLSDIKLWIAIGQHDIGRPWQDYLDYEGVVPNIVVKPDEDVASIIYTSGTTGRPKGAMLTHRNLVSNTNSCMQSLDWRPGKEIILVVLPMFHSFASTVGMLTPLLHGCCSVLVPKFDIHLVVDAIAQHKATIFMGVPTMYGMLLELPDDEISKFDTIRYGLAGGASMPLAIMQRFEQRFGKLIYEGDGPSECSPVTCVNPVGSKRKPGSVGLPVANVEMRICDERGGLVPDNEIGEICVRGPNVMKGYWNRPKETAESFFGDWYRTGDLGCRDEEGYFYIVDRLKDMLIVNGMNVYPKMVEEVLYQCQGVKEAAVIGVPDELHGEVPVAYVVCDPDSKQDQDSITAYCADKLAKYQIPRTIYIVEDLPKTPTGKILKRELRKQGESERGVNPATPK